MLFKTFPKLKLGLYFGKNMLTMDELIGYVDFMDCCNIWPKHPEDNDEQNGVGKF